MGNWVNDFKPIITEIEQSAYQRGWDDALKHVLEVARNPVHPSQRTLPLMQEGTNGAHPGAMTMVETVFDLIRTRPGLKGFAIVKAIHLGQPNKDKRSIDRTARTALMRLRKRGSIESRNGKWYPRGDTQ